MKYPHTATLKTLSASGGKYTYGGSTTTPCFLQPLDPEYANKLGFNMTKSFKCFVPYSADIKESMRLVIDGVTYGVAGVSEHNYGNLTHKRLILERQ